MRCRLVACVALIVGCATVRYPGAYPPPANHPHDFLREQVITFQGRGSARSFNAILQKLGDRLTLLGLSPFGAKVFAVEQAGSVISEQRFLPLATPIPLKTMLNDVERTWFRGLSLGPLSDGWHEGAQDGELLRERWSGGRLEERRFTRLDHAPSGEIVVTYVGGMKDDRAPDTVRFENGWLGYRLIIKTVAETNLSGVR